jgi:hypothetical protein
MVLSKTVVSRSPFVLNLSEHERGSSFDKLRTNGETMSARSLRQRALGSLAGETYFR